MQTNLPESRACSGGNTVFKGKLFYNFRKDICMKTSLGEFLRPLQLVLKELLNGTGKCEVPDYHMHVVHICNIWVPGQLPVLVRSSPTLPPEKRLSHFSSTSIKV